MINNLFIVYFLDGEEMEFCIDTSNLNLNKEELSELNNIYIKYNINREYIYFDDMQYDIAQELISNIMNDVFELIQKIRFKNFDNVFFYAPRDYETEYHFDYSIIAFGDTESLNNLINDLDEIKNEEVFIYEEYIEVSYNYNDLDEYHGFYTENDIINLIKKHNLQSFSMIG